MLINDHFTSRRGIRSWRDFIRLSDVLIGKKRDLPINEEEKGNKASRNSFSSSEIRNGLTDDMMEDTLKQTSYQTLCWFTNMQLH